MLKIALIQARNEGDVALAHELDCFRQRAPGHEIAGVNLVTDPFSPSELASYDAIMIGGSGDYSVTNLTPAWGKTLYDIVAHIVDARIPMFASCFGFQALVVALGGVVERRADRAEVGTFELSLTDAGSDDPLFGSLPPAFNAQLGHNDSSIQLPDTLALLASSERCPHQAVRVVGAPIYATQFHPELTHHDNIYRFLRYLAAYRPELSEEEARIEAESMHAPSPEANSLIGRFLDQLEHL